MTVDVAAWDGTALPTTIPAAKSIAVATATMILTVGFRS